MRETAQAPMIIRHVMADGTVLRSIDGHMVSFTQATYTAYRILIGILEKDRERKAG